MKHTNQGNRFERVGRDAESQQAMSAVWLDRLDTVQVGSVVIGIAAIPTAFVIMVATGSAILTVAALCVLPLAGLVFGACAVAKGVIEARGILTDGEMGH